MARKKPTSTQHEIRSLAASFIFALVLAVAFRTFAFEPFHIPSGSMKPTLLVGDYIFVSKYAYGYSRYSLPFGVPLIKGRILEEHLPKRGDVVVFKLPSDPDINYIKRLVGLPGDTIQVVHGILYINGAPVPREWNHTFTDEGRQVPRYIETLPNGVHYNVLDRLIDGPEDNTIKFYVPQGHYFFMGDNRDDSLDSRANVGFVPAENLVGRAEIIFFSNGKPWWDVWEKVDSRL